MGSNPHIYSPFRLVSPQNISIGNNFSSLGNLSLFSNNGKITIGDNVAINVNVLIAGSGAEIKIGNDVLIGPNVVIRSADHIFKEKNKKINVQGHKGDSILIGNDVWIGSNVVILKGVSIGDGSVIAAGSVVTKCIDSYTVVAGVPAKEISKRN